MENASNKPEYRKRSSLWPLSLLVAASVTAAAASVGMPFGLQTAAVEWVSWPLLLLLVVATVTMVAFPVYVHTPFKAQTADDLEWTYRLRRLSPPVTTVALILFVALGAGLWQGSSWWGRTAMILLLALLVVAAWFSRQPYYYEWAFRPLSDVTHAPVGEATFLPDSDMVLAVEINGDAVAYPIRQLAYHHIIGDRVGGKPITATY